jgi:hypothetical protein
VPQHVVQSPGPEAQRVAGFLTLARPTIFEGEILMNRIEEEIKRANEFGDTLSSRKGNGSTIIATQC